MSYLIDGNNVMGQRVGWHRDKRRAQRDLLDEVAQFARRAHVRAAVVFDGAPDDHFPDGALYRGVEVFYAERNSNADERIKRMVDASRERRTLVVVTSDRALADYVRRSGAQIVRAGEFRRRLENFDADSDRASPRGRDETVSGEELTRWMRYFGAAPGDDEQ